MLDCMPPLLIPLIHSMFNARKERKKKSNRKDQQGLINKSHIYTYHVTIQLSFIMCPSIAQVSFRHPTPPSITAPPIPSASPSATRQRLAPCWTWPSSSSATCSRAPASPSLWTAPVQWSQCPSAGVTSGSCGGNSF